MQRRAGAGTARELENRSHAGESHDFETKVVKVTAPHDRYPSVRGQLGLPLSWSILSFQQDCAEHPSRRLRALRAKALSKNETSRTSNYK